MTVSSEAPDPVPPWLRAALARHDPILLNRYDAWRAARKASDRSPGPAETLAFAEEDHCLGLFAASPAHALTGALAKLEIIFETEETVEQALDPSNRLIVPRLLLGLLLDLRRLATRAA
ncbi:MAG: hypothetical protein GVY13_14950 [Alphaproteobacteria bacterium]|nr:hypothetical protein [Alphaproteobacteria bacterium]